VRVRAVVAAAIASAWVLGAVTGLPVGHETAAAAATVNVGAPSSSGATQRLPALLNAISSQQPGEVSLYLRSNQHTIERALAAPGSAHLVVEWWGGLADVQRGALERNAPELLGNLEGIPFSVRDSINRRLLDSRLAAADASSNAKATPSGATQDRAAGLRSIEKALKSPRGGPKRTLATFDPSGSMRAAVVIGDIDRADDVSFLVPGMYYTVKDQLVDWTATAQAVYDTQRALLTRLGTPGRTVATVAWLGYHTPDLSSVLKLDDAKAGAQWLDDALTGVRALRGSHQPYLSVLAHSYGSTAALLALFTGGVSVDALAVVGCPGGAASSVYDLDVRDGNVYVGSALLDPVAGSGLFGTDPGGESYGAHRMGTRGGIDPIDGRLMLPTIGHNGYFAPGTESLRNLALVALGDGAMTTGP
jgi:hypothetical protein